MGAGHPPIQVNEVWGRQDRSGQSQKVKVHQAVSPRDGGPTPYSYNASGSGKKPLGSCASCWAFTAAATVEGRLAKNSQQLTSLSEQNLVDCAKSYQDEGCNAGWVNEAYKYIKENGIESSSTYPYKAKKESCKFNQQDSVGTISSYKSSWSATEEEMMTLVADHGPISVYVFMSKAFMEFKGSGIFDDSNCNKDVNHAVTVVGYVNNANESYWIIKNSFGKGWGDNGYMKMIMFKNMCSITTHIHYLTA
ncbi:procathepsin L-like [Heterodontus francisci]|uniref:procathepsin L-like n=1 Tax=Heterodontus francisci TaxID=7792 RepID=UPI00355BDD49